MTPSTNNVLDAAIGAVILPELHQYFLNVFLGCRNSLDKGPPQALKAILFLDLLVGSKREKHYIDIGMKTTSKGGCVRAFSTISKILKGVLFFKQHFFVFLLEQLRRHLELFIAL
jgi:hypothetical protein